MREMLQYVRRMLDTVKEHNKDLEILTSQLAKATDAKTVFVRETSHEIRHRSMPSLASASCYS